MIILKLLISSFDSNDMQFNIIPIMRVAPIAILVMPFPHLNKFMKPYILRICQALPYDNMEPCLHILIILLQLLWP